MEIKNLERLETLDISWTQVTELSKEIGELQHLRTPDIICTLVRKLPKEIRKLQHLRTLDLRGTEVRELTSEVENSINLLVGNLDSVKIVKLATEVVSPDWDISSPGGNCRGGLPIVFLKTIKFEALLVPLLRVDGRHMKVPQWVKQDLCNVCTLDISLCKLVEEDLEFLKTMPNLQALQLRFEVLPRQPVAITGGGFFKLETFYVDCHLPRVTFKREAMPKLKHLVFKFYTGTASQDYYMGIKHLRKLEFVIFRCSEYYTSDKLGVSATIEVLRKEATEHPNKITLHVNDMRPEVFGSGATQINLSDKANLEKESEEREKEFEEWEKEVKRRERVIEERRKHIREQRLRLRTAAEGRARQDKIKARAGTEKEIQKRKSNLEITERRLREAERKNIE